MRFKTTIWILLAVTLAFGTVVGFTAGSQALDDDAIGTRPPEPVNRATTAALGSTNCGDINANGSVNSADVISLVNYVFKGGAAPDCPGCSFSWGSVTVGGAIDNAGSGDWTVYWDSVLSRYEITITGQSYYFSNWHASVTPIASGGVIANTRSVGGALLVYMTNHAGTPRQESFTFTVVKF